MRNLNLTLLIALLSLNITAQDCAINLPDSLFVCGLQTVLSVDTDGGIWSYDCMDTDQSFTVESLSNGQYQLTFSSCGVYTLNYAVEIAGNCNNNEDIVLYVENPSSTSTVYSHNNSLEYGQVTCHSSGSAACINTISISGQAPPSPTWEICSEASCSSTVVSSVVDNPNSDCEANTISLDTLSLMVNNSSCWSGTQDSFVVIDASSGDIINAFEDFIDSLLIADVLSGFDGCSANVDPCFELTESCIDSIEYDTINRLFPIHLGGGWHYISTSNDTIPLMDTTNVTINFLDYLFIISPGADYYGPDNIDFSIYQLINNGIDTIEPSETVGIQLQWIESWAYDTIEVILPEVIYSDSLACQVCGGDFFDSFYNIPDIPDYPCGSIFLSFDYGCICEPIEVFVNGGSITCENDCTFLDGFVDSPLGYYSEWLSPDGDFFPGDFIEVCLPGTYVFFVITDDGCFIEEYFDVQDTRVDIAIIIPEPDIISSDQECVDLIPDISFSANTQAIYAWSGPNGFSSEEAIISVCEPGEYELTVITIPGQCQASQSVIVEENENIIEPLQADICAGDCYNYNGQDYCEAGIYYIPIDNFVTIELTIQVIQPEEVFIEETICSGDIFELGGNTYLETGNYMFSLSSATDCDTLVYLELEVLESETTLLTEDICAGDEITIGNQSFSESGTYEITLVGAVGCDSVVLLDLEVLPSVPIIQDQLIQACSFESVRLELNEQLDPFNILWDNGTSGLIRDITEPGTYTATISNNCGSETVLFTVEETGVSQHEVVLPNVFSPNNDGVNDLFTVAQGANLITFEIRIFDRWGSVVFESQDPTQAWNGEYKGQKAPTNNYVYQVSLISEQCDGLLKEEQLTGSVLLVR